MNNSPPRILVVEDEEISMMIVEHILKREGYEVEKARNGELALEKVREELFSLILMDIEMPVMSGLEAAPEIRKLENGKNVPIIALTAHTLSEYLEKIDQAGMDGYVTKPFDQDNFKQIAEKYFITE